MQIADEIRELKNLLDDGVLTPDEYEGAKQGLLSKFSAAVGNAMRNESFVGRWRLIHPKLADCESAEVNLSVNGNAELRFAKTGVPPLAAAFASVVGLKGGFGKWWIDGNELVLAVKLGNRLTQSLFTRLTGGISALDIHCSLISISPQEIRGIEAGSTNELRLLRLGV